MAFKILNISSEAVFLNSIQQEIPSKETIILDVKVLHPSIKALQKKNLIFVDHVSQDELFQIELSKNRGQKIVEEEESEEKKSSKSKDKK